MPQNLHNLKPLRNPHDRRFEPLLLPWSLTTLQSAKKREAVTVPGANKWTPCLVFDKRQLVCFVDAVRRRRKKRKKDSIGVSQTFSSSPKWNGSLLSHKEGYESPFQFAAVGCLIQRTEVLPRHTLLSPTRGKASRRRPMGDTIDGL